MMKLVVFFLLLAFITPSVFPCGKKEKNNVQPVSAETSITEGQGTKNMIKITGRISIYGSEPHTFVGIVDEMGTEFAVYPPEQEEKLRLLQGRLIEFTVIMLDKPMGEGGLYLKGGTVNPVEWSIIR